MDHVLKHIPRWCNYCQHEGHLIIDYWLLKNLCGEALWTMLLWKCRTNWMWNNNNTLEELCWPTKRTQCTIWILKNQYGSQMAWKCKKHQPWFKFQPPSHPHFVSNWVWLTIVTTRMEYTKTNPYNVQVWCLQFRQFNQWKPHDKCITFYLFTLECHQFYICPTHHHEEWCLEQLHKQRWK